MASQLTRAEVAHIADLARLELSATEQELFARQLTDILAYAAVVQEADTSTDKTAAADAPERRNPGTAAPRNPGTAAPRHPGTPEPRNPQLALRSDVPVPSLARDEVLAEAPNAAREAGLFRVPKVI